MENNTVQSHTQDRKGLAIAALVLGIVAVSTGLFFYFSLPTGITAIVLAAISLKRRYAGRGMALAGLITAIVGVAFGLITLAFFIFSIVAGYDTGSMQTF